MGKTIKGNFAADGDSVELNGVKRFTVCLGTDTNQSFGGGTISFKIKQEGQNDFTTDSMLFTKSNVITSQAYVGGATFKLNLSGSTSPNLDYSITYE